MPATADSVFAAIEVFKTFDNGSDGCESSADRDKEEFAPPRILVQGMSGIDYINRAMTIEVANRADRLMLGKCQNCGQPKEEEHFANCTTLEPEEGKDYYGGWAVGEFIEGQDLDFRLGNVVKYVARAGKKDPERYVEDLKKARDYLDRAIILAEENDDEREDEG